MWLIKKVKSYLSLIQSIIERLDKLQISLGRIESRQLECLASNVLSKNEFQVYSQWGEDGVIQFLLRHVAVKTKIFVEFGVQNYLESNTRFLLVNNNWAGLVIDGSEDNIRYIKNDPIFWKHNLKAVHAFITKENINKLLQDNGIVGEIGLLSIDIDGNDYWVWEAIDVINPMIVVVEYNARFGSARAVTVPYRADFIRSKAHHSLIYYGASLRALTKLAHVKGYALVGCNQAGNNAFFVRRDLLDGRIDELTVDDAYVSNQFRETRNEVGDLVFISKDDELKQIKELPIVDLDEWEDV